MIFFFSGFTASRIQFIITTEGSRNINSFRAGHTITAGSASHLDFPIDFLSDLFIKPLSLIIPENYKPLLPLRETQVAIKQVKDFFQCELAKTLNLTRVSVSYTHLDVYKRQ